MRALLLETLDGPSGLRITEQPTPESRDGHVILDVRAIGINFPDLLATKGQYQNRDPLPFVPGCEIAGVVADAPPDSPLVVGERASAFVWSGGYAERASVPYGGLVPLPETVDFVAGAGMMVNYNTVHFALARRGQIAAGETLLVLGAAGGIGTAAVQVGGGLGARVIGGVADEEQLETARAAGADEAIVLTEGFADGVRAMTDGKGADVVLDPLGDWLFTEATRALRPEGRILVVGFAAGEIPTLKVNRLLLKNISAVGVAWGAFLDLDPSMIETASAALAKMYRDGAIEPQVSERYSFDQIPEALSRLEQHRIRGKAVALVEQG